MFNAGFSTGEDMIEKQLKITKEVFNQLNKKAYSIKVRSFYY